MNDSVTVKTRVTHAFVLAIGALAVDCVHAQRQLDVKPEQMQIFEAQRQVIGGGGGTSTGGSFAISGTVGQADADPLQPSTGGVFAITGGFWAIVAPAAPLGDPIFDNGFEPQAR